MKTFATQEKRPAPAARKARPYVHHPMGPVQRAQQAEIRRILRSTGAQAKLTIGQPNDKYEQEADRVADRVTAMPDPRLQRQPEAEEEEETLQAKPLADQITPLVQRQEEPTEEEEEEPVQAKFKVGEMIQRMCPECDGETAQRQPMKEEEEELQTKTKPGETPAVTPGLASTINGLKGGGQPLDSATRAFFEPRFGRDFGHVRLHTDSEAAETASSINARAYTLGNHIALEAGEYQPNSRSGQRLLGHELTHVIQQGKGRKSVGDQFRKSYRTAPVDRVDSGQIIRRDLLEDLRRMAEEAGKARLRELADQPVGPGGWTGADPGCHAKFCRPFASLPRAVADLAWAGPLILAGIATKVNSRVVPLWARYISGGSGVQNLSGRFGTDFTSSLTTRDTSRFLVGELRSLVEREHATLIGGAPSVTVDVSGNLLAARQAINTPGGANEMNFDYPTDIAGNIAGGIGADQTAHRFGARPSPVDDSRAARITATLVRNASGTITVTPSIRFRVTDTIDLCPGNCGTIDEQVATVPLSRFEATGLVGDVPFNIDFDAPAAELGAFTVTPAAPLPVHGEVTASALRYRAAPNTSAAILGQYPRGTNIEVQCQTTGTTVRGVDTWYRTADGFVAGRYVSLLGPGTPPVC